MYHAGMMLVGTLLSISLGLFFSRHMRISLTKQFVPGYAVQLAAMGSPLRAALSALVTAANRPITLGPLFGEPPHSAETRARRFTLWGAAASGPAENAKVGSGVPSVTAP